MPSPPTLFIIPESLRLLALWNIEVQDEGPAVSNGWRPWQPSGKTRHLKTFNPSSLIGWNTLVGSLSTRKSTILNSNKRLSESFPQGEIRQGSEFCQILYLSPPVLWLGRDVIPNCLVHVDYQVKRAIPRNDIEPVKECVNDGLQNFIVSLLVQSS
jgi:hypothetical protein